jgi:hypothetical protein
MYTYTYKYVYSYKLLRIFRIAVAELNGLLESFRHEYNRLKSLPKSSGGAACNISDACTREFHRVEIILLCRLSRLLLQVIYTVYVCMYSYVYVYINICTYIFI